MAIDTQTKRRSVSGYSNHLVYPLADGTIAEADRAHTAWLYSGIDYDAPAAIVGIIALTVRDRPTQLTVLDREPN